jgi:hypothetical protein
MDITAWNSRAQQTLRTVEARWRHFLGWLETAPCRLCGAPIYVAAEVAKASPQHKSPWHISSEKVAVQCGECRNCFWIYTFPPLNRIPDSRTLIAIAAVNLLLATLLLLILY